MYDYNTVANQKVIEKNEDIEGDRRGWMWKEMRGRYPKHLQRKILSWRSM
jgi:hypothetical protein